MKRSWEAAVLKALRARDYCLTVLGTEAVTDRYHRVRVDGGRLLAECGVHPTMWLRLWFDDGGKPHQRAYTLVDPDPATGRFDLEFALHDGCAARWALRVAPGDTIDATVYGSRFESPEPPPRRLWLAGDPASLPAVNSLLDAFPDTPAQVWLEHADDSDRGLPVRARERHAVTWLPRGPDGRQLVDTVCAALAGDATDQATAPAADSAADPAADWFWVACEAASTRAITRYLRRTLHVRPERMSAVGYWRAV